MVKHSENAETFESWFIQWKVLTKTTSKWLTMWDSAKERQRFGQKRKQRSVRIKSGWYFSIRNQANGKKKETELRNGIQMSGKRRREYSWFFGNGKQLYMCFGIKIFECFMPKMSLCQNVNENCENKTRKFMVFGLASQWLANEYTSSTAICTRLYNRTK